jgi:hypothetical protein
MCMCMLGEQMRPRGRQRPPRGRRATVPVAMLVHATAPVLVRVRMVVLGHDPYPLAFGRWPHSASAIRIVAPHATDLQGDTSGRSAAEPDHRLEEDAPAAATAGAKRCRRP